MKTENTLRATPLWFCALLAVFLFEAFTLKLWLGIDTRPPAWDESIHLSVALDYSEALKTDHWQRLLEPAYFNYPPLYHLTLVPALRAAQEKHLSGGEVVDRTIFTNAAYLVLFGTALFFLGLELSGPAAGFAAGVFGTAAPFVTEISHFPLIDLALSGWVAWAFYALIKSKQFSHWIPSLAFGVLCGIGTLTKWNFFTYVSVPALWCVGLALVRKRPGPALIAFLIFLAMILPWYLHNAIPVFTRVVGCARMGATEGDPSVGSLESWLYYPRTVVLQLHAGLTLLTLAGLLIAFFKRDRWILIVWGFLPMVFWSLISNKDYRYCMPCLGALALLAATVIPERGRILVFYACAAVLLGQFYDCFGTASRVFHWKGTDIPLYDPRPPQTEDWKQSEIARYCLLHRDRTDPLTTISTVENTPYLHSTTMNLNARLEGMKPLVFRGKTKRLGELSQFILTKTGDLGPEFALGDIPPVAHFLQNPDPWFEQSYRKGPTWPLPDGSQAILFERKIQPVPIPQVKRLEMEMDQMSLPDIEMEGLSLKLSATTGAEAAQGLFKQIEIVARSLKFKGIPLQNVRLLLKGAQIDWPLFLATKEVRLMRLERAEVDIFVPRQELENFAQKKLHGVKNFSLRFEKGNLTARGSFRGLTFEAGESILFQPERSALAFHLTQIRVAGVPLPLIPIVLSPFTDRSVSLKPNSEIPFFIDLHAIEWSPDGLRIH